MVFVNVVKFANALKAKLAKFIFLHKIISLQNIEQFLLLGKCTTKRLENK